MKTLRVAFTHLEIISIRSQHDFEEFLKIKGIDIRKPYTQFDDIENEQVIFTQKQE